MWRKRPSALKSSQTTTITTKSSTWNVSRRELPNTAENVCMTPSDLASVQIPLPWIAMLFLMMRFYHYVNVAWKADNGDAREPSVSVISARASRCSRGKADGHASSYTKSRFQQRKRRPPSYLPLLKDKENSDTVKTVILLTHFAWSANIAEPVKCVSASCGHRANRARKQSKDDKNNRSMQIIYPLLDLVD